MSDRPRIVEFYMALSSRYSYLAASQVERIQKTYDCVFDWKPFSTFSLMNASQPDRSVQPEAVSGQYVRQYRVYDAECWAAHYGIAYNEPHNFYIDPPELALAARAAGEQGKLVECCRAIHQMVYVQGLVVDRDVLEGLPALLDIDSTAFNQALDSERLRDEYARDVVAARERGVFGVPTFFYGPHMFWGNDRLPLLEAVLAGAALPTTGSLTQPGSSAA